MSWGSVAIGVGSAVAGIAGAVGSSNASRNAANAQSAAAGAASQQQIDAARRAEQLQREQYRNSWALLAPDARAGRRAQSAINAILYGGRRATPAATPAAPSTAMDPNADGGFANDERVPGQAGGPSGGARAATPQWDWDAYESEWRPTTLNNPTSPFHAYLASAQAANPNLSWGEAFYNWSGGIYGRPQAINPEDTNDWLLDEYGDLMGDYEDADLDEVMGDFRNTPFYQMSEDAIAAESAASDLATEKALAEWMHRAGAAGSVLSGNALRGMAETRNNFGVANATSAAGRRQQTFGDWFDMLQDETDNGRRAVGGMISGGGSYASSAGNLRVRAGDSAARATLNSAAARAQGQQGAAAAWGNGINTAITGLTSAANAWSNRSPYFTPVNSVTPTTFNSAPDTSWMRNDIRWG